MSDLTRTSLNLYTEDVEYLKAQYGYGWTERVRELVHEVIRLSVKPLTVADFLDEEAEPEPFPDEQ